MGNSGSGSGSDLSSDHTLSAASLERERVAKQRDSVGKLLWWISLSGFCVTANTLVLGMITLSTANAIPCTPVIWHIEVTYTSNPTWSNVTKWCNRNDRNSTNACCLSGCDPSVNTY